MESLNRRTICLSLHDKGHHFHIFFDCSASANFALIYVCLVLKNENNKKSKKSKTDTENIEEVLKSLKQNGFGDAKIFTANDLKNMKSSNELNDLLKREQQQQSQSQQQSQQHSKSSSSKKRRKDVEDADADVVDLDL